ncbi:MAG: hypothetical protein HYU98_07900 [Deltaproteobacteria bacterium]|nr:hypothetical protein [Deltaproteobacteria bacterium]
MAEFDEDAFMNKMKALVLAGILFIMIGAVLQVSAFILEFTKFTPILDELMPLQKSVADNADPASRIAMLKTEAAKFPPKLMTFKLVGIGSILMGVFIMLLVIVQALRVMPLRISKVLRELQAEQKNSKRR